MHEGDMRVSDISWVQSNRVLRVASDFLTMHLFIIIHDNLSRPAFPYIDELSSWLWSCEKLNGHLEAFSVGQVSNHLEFDYSTVYGVDW